MFHEKYRDLSDDEILDFIRRGDRDAADYLMERYKNLVKKKARTLYLIGNDREDLIQEGMIGLYKAVRDYKQNGEASFQTFADLCVSRQMYNAVKVSNTKKNQPLNNYISFDAINYYQNDGTTERSSFGALLEQNKVRNPEEMAIGKVIANRIEDALEKELSQMEREVLALYLQDYGYSKIAEKLGKEVKSVDNAMQRIKKKLHCILKNM